jgi:hypothetical protein
MNVIPLDVLVNILSFRYWALDEYFVTIGLLRKLSFVNSVYYLATRYFPYKKEYIRLKKIMYFLAKYPAYQREYEQDMVLPWCPKVSNPILLDIMFANCVFPHAFSSLQSTDISGVDLEKDIEEIVALLPSSVNCEYGRLRSREQVTPLFAACINKNISLNIIKILIQCGANIEHNIQINGIKVKMLSDIKNECDPSRFVSIHQMFHDYAQ